MKNIKIEMDIENYPSLLQFSKTIDNRVDFIDVYINSNNISIYATDMKSGSNIIVQQPTEISHLIGGKVSSSNETGIIQELDESLETLFDGGEISWDNNDSNNNINDNKDSEVTNKEKLEDEISFSVSSSFINVILAFKKCIFDIDFENNSMIIWSSDYKNTATLPISPAYQNLENEVELLKKSRWIELDLGSIRNIIRVLDKIEAKKYRQTITLEDNKVYTYSDSIACECPIENINNKYVFDYEIIRILKYGCHKDSIIYITKLENDQLVFDIDGMKIIYPTNEIATINLIEEIVNLKFNKFIVASKSIVDSIKLVNKFITDTKMVNIVSISEGISIMNDRITSYNNEKGSNIGNLRINIDTLLIALSIAGENPTIYIEDADKIKEHPIVKISGNINVIIEGETYEPYSIL